PEAVRMAEILQRAAATLQEAVRRLPKMEDISELFARMQALENEADDVNRRAMADLYAGAVEVADLVRVMKWQDIITRLEDAADTFKAVFERIQQIIIKHA